MAEPTHFQIQEKIHLCRGDYLAAAGLAIPPLSVLCQVVPVNGAAYAWVDGLSYDNPVLVPVALLRNVRSVGTLRDFLADPRNESLPEFDSFLEIVFEQRVSATVAARALEIMHAEGSDASQSIAHAQQMGLLIVDIDAADRQAHNAHYSVEQTDSSSSSPASLH